MFLSVFGVRVEQSMGQMSPNGNVSGKNLALVSSISVLYVPRSTYMGLTWINGILSSIMNEIPHNGYLGSYKGVTYHSLWHICWASVACWGTYYLMTKCEPGTHGIPPSSPGNLVSSTPPASSNHPHTSTSTLCRRPTSLDPWPHGVLMQNMKKMENASVSFKKNQGYQLAEIIQEPTADSKFHGLTGAWISPNKMASHHLISSISPLRLKNLSPSYLVIHLNHLNISLFHLIIPVGW